MLLLFVLLLRGELGVLEKVDGVVIILGEEFVDVAGLARVERREEGLVGRVGLLLAVGRLMMLDVLLSILLVVEVVRID